MDGPLRYLHDYKVVLCSACGHCIKGDGVELHLQRFHQDVQRSLRKEWCRQVKDKLDSGDLMEPEKVVSPERTLGPVKDLRIVDGFECLSCGYVCGTLGTAEFHGRTHGWRIGKKETWKSQHVQVIYCFDVLNSRLSLPGN